MSAALTRPLLAALALGLAFTSASFAQDAARECGGYPAPMIPDLTPIAAAEGTATVTSPFGDVELPTAPARALGMYTTDVDILIWLGYPLAPSQPIRGDSGYTTFPCFFPQAQLEGVTPFGNYPEYNYEQILLADPDFILSGLGYDTDVNERLPQIAPTYSLNAYDGKSWQDYFKETATALGRSDRYDAWLAVYEARIAEVKEQIKGNADAVVAPFAFWGGKYAAACYVGVECTVFRDLGLTILEGATLNDGAGLELSPEELGKVQDLDFAFMIVGVGEEGAAAQQAVIDEAEKNPLWANLNFVKNDGIVPHEMEMTFGSPSGQLAFLEVVAKALSK